MKREAGSRQLATHTGKPPSPGREFYFHVALNWRENIKRLSTGFTILFAGFLLISCAPKKPLMTLPSKEQSQIAALEKENADLKAALTKLEKNCTAVLELHRRAQKYGNSPEAKEK